MMKETKLPVYRIIFLGLKSLTLGTYLGIQLERENPNWWYKGTIAISIFVFFLFAEMAFNFWYGKRKKEQEVFDNFLKEDEKKNTGNP
jgi:hypothetical protein